jgi:hypothetical protein
VMTESAARIGINTAAPTHALTVLGGPKWTAGGWTGSVALPNAGAIGWGANSAGQRRGLGHGNTGLIFFRTASNPGAAAGAITADLVIGNTGNVGVGTATPASKLTVNGGIQILGAGNGIRFADGSIQTKATSGTINGTGAANRLAKFTGPNSFGNSSITEVSGNVGIGTAAPLTALDVRGSLTIEAGGSPELYTSVAGSEQNRYLQLVNSLSVRSASGLKAGGVLVSDNYGYANPGKNELIVKGRARIDAGLEVKGGILALSSGYETAVYGRSESGTGVVGSSTSGHGVYGSSTSSYAGYFTGKAIVTGNLEVGSCTGCTISSDRGLKALVSSVDPRTVLDRLAALPIKSWSYKTDSPSVRHLGPMAQDFRAAFNLGADDKHIDMVDANGVTMASIQALYQMMKEKERQNEQLAGEVRQLRAQMTQQQSRLLQQQAQLNQVRRAVRGRRAAKR